MGANYLAYKKELIEIFPNELDDSNDDANSVIWVKLVIKINYGYFSNCENKL